MENAICFWNLIWTCSSCHCPLSPCVCPCLEMVISMLSSWQGMDFYSLFLNAPLNENVTSCCACYYYYYFQPSSCCFYLENEIWTFLGNEIWSENGTLNEIVNAFALEKVSVCDPLSNPLRETVWPTALILLCRQSFYLSFLRRHPLHLSRPRTPQKHTLLNGHRE